MKCFNIAWHSEAVRPQGLADEMQQAGFAGFPKPIERKNSSRGRSVSSAADRAGVADIQDSVAALSELNKRRRDASLVVK